MRTLRSIIAATLFVAVATAPTITIAATAKKEEAAKKELSPQQQKMKDCAAKWRVEKEAKKVSGRKAYNEFMRTCLKG